MLYCDEHDLFEGSKFPLTSITATQNDRFKIIAFYETIVISLNVVVIVVVICIFVLNN